MTLQTPEISQAERVKMIRVNKNAVLEHSKSLLAEKGVEVADDQAFDLAVNFQDGSVSITGIEDEELSAAVNEALAGDEELMTLIAENPG